MRVNDIVLVNGVPHKVTYIRQDGRFSLSPYQAKTFPRGDEIDIEWMPDDPVYPVFQKPTGQWTTTEKPQFIHGTIYQDLLGVDSGYVGLYGVQYLQRCDLFKIIEDAENECDRRNKARDALTDNIRRAAV